MFENQNYFPMVVEGLGNRVKEMVLFVENAQCVCMKVVFLVFIIFDVRLFR